MANVGDRIELISMVDDPREIPSGEQGTITSVNKVEILGFTQFTVDWDGPYSLMLCVPPDLFRVLPSSEEE